MTDNTYADRWREPINETYEGIQDDPLFWAFCGSDLNEDQVIEVLTKAARCLRGGESHTFNGQELDIVRHMMPAHEVHQSGAARWMLDRFDVEVKTW